MLGELVVPVLRREFAALKPAGVPDAPIHPRVAAARSLRDSAPAPTDSQRVEVPA
jgi:hypothetical protein